MPPRSSRRPKIPSRAIAILGAAVAGTLLVAAASKFGDPRLAARAQATSSARARGELVRLAWDAMLRSENPPGSAGPVLRIDTAAAETQGVLCHNTAGEMVAPKGDDPSNLFNVLLESSYGDAARGDLAAAISTARDAVQLSPESRGPGEARLAECHLALARWWSALEEHLEVAAQRRAIADLPGTYYLEGTSIELLACLVPPTDHRRAHELLLDGRPDLPSPVDRFTVQAGEVKFEADPWWSALQQQLEWRFEGDLDWDAAFQLPARADRAGRDWLMGQDLPEAGSGWQLTQLGPGDSSLIALRQDASLQAAVVRPTDLEAALLKATAHEVQLPFELRFGPGPEAGAGDREVLYGPDFLPQLSRPFSIYNMDPEREARGELTRLALLRGALVILALAVLGVSLLGAKALSRSRRLAALRSTFVASVSHELRTPTQAILLLAETLEQGRVGRGSAATRKSYYSRIRREAQRLRRLVEDLLDSARIDRGEGARIQRSEVVSAPFISELERAMKERAVSGDATLDVQRGELPESLFVDPDGVHRAVWNLFENALRYGKSEDGTTRVSVEFAHSDGILEVTVADQGAGIDAADKEAVFAPFERLDGRKMRGRRNRASAKASSDDSGTGLGLTIVRAIARGHGGDATIEETAGGALFKLTFPDDDRHVDEAA